MKRIATLLLSLAGLVGLASQLSAQAPIITQVPFRQAYGTQRIVIKGFNLALVGVVRLDGVSVPILSKQANQITAGPLDGAQIPGFLSTVSVQAGTAGAIATAPIEFTPSLKAVRRANRMDITIRNGDVGSYILRGSYGTFGGASDAGIYYTRFLPGGTSSFVVRTGTVADDQPVLLYNLLVPIQLGISGVPLNLQAQCTIGVSEFQSYTNKVSIPGYGLP